MAVGDPREAATRVGPLITPEHFERVKGFVDRALARRRVALWGGRAPRVRARSTSSRRFSRNVRADSEIAQREVFGPVLTWQTFGDDDEVSRRWPMGRRFGLAAVALHAATSARAHRMASRLVAGTVWVNCFFVRDLAAPFGGARDSGIGREGGTWSFDFFSDVKNVAIRKGSFGQEAHHG